MTHIELAVLACMFLDEDRQWVKLHELNVDLFPMYPEFFKAVQKYCLEGGKFDLMIARDRLGADYTKRLMENFNYIHLSNYDTYVDILRKLAATNRIQKQIKEGQLTGDALRSALKDLETESNNDKDYDMEADLDIFLLELRKRMKDDYEHFDLGIPELDETLGPIVPGNLVVFAGDSGVGKTTFALKIFKHLIAKQVTTLVMSSEMGYYDVISKYCAINTGVNAKRIRSGKISEAEYNVIRDALVARYGFPGKISTLGILDMERIRVKIEQYKTKFVIIDYIGMFSIADLRGMNKADYLEEVAKKLKGIAVEKDMVVIALSQVNAQGEVKSSRAIREKADILITLEQVKESQTSKEIKLVITKSRYSETKIFEYIMDKETGEFTKKTMDNFIPDSDSRNYTGDN